ncbi:hypothetical protein ABXV23_19050 [Vibrio owensii]|uniref:fimbrial biogenesis chaperone n=1 Tax=Vibrio owensii TaxID=696485 RepID=UPI003398CE21
MERVLAIALVLLFSSSSWSYEVSPIYKEMEPSGQLSNSFYEVVNPENRDIAIEISAFKVKFGPEGESLSDAASNFLILPPQVIIKPNSSQKFRVRFIPTGQLSATETYRLVFRELKLRDTLNEQQGSELSMLVNFSTLVFVSPNNSKPTPNVSLDKGKLIVSNNGNRVLNMSQLSFEITKDGKKEQITWRDVNSNTSAYLLPGSKTSYVLPPSLSNASNAAISK